MCGITGFLTPDQAADAELARAMAMTMQHRGPDHVNAWAEGHVALGHSRLSIIDLSEHANQPMVTNRLALVFNGEIYNFRELRKELADFPFRSESDTEVLLAAIQAWGLEAALGRIHGMFAFALWDRKEHKLHLARDRVGIKPLYYGWSGSVFMFGSELKAMRKHPAWQAGIDRNSLALFFRHSYIPSPYSIFRDIRKVIPGVMITLDTTSRTMSETVYWSAADITAKATPFTGSEDEAAAHLETLLDLAVRQRLVADVPLGAFLSGGIDSSLIVALMRRHCKVDTFTIGFEQAEYNEAPHARAIAGHLGTNHTELTITANDARKVVPLLPAMYDEPFADSSQIPTHLLCAMTRKSVTVALSGDGGDEVFAGYKRYYYGRRLWRTISRMPHAVRMLASVSANTLGRSRLTRLKTMAEGFIPAPRGPRIPGDGIQLVARMLGSATPGELFMALSSHQADPLALVRQSGSLETPFTALDHMPAELTFLRRMLLADLLCYHPDDILTKVDRASMAVSLEVRVPLVDHRVIEFAARLPDNMLLRQKAGKWLLRRVLYQYVPRELLERPKSGFAMPVGAWLRGDLREWAQELLDPDLIRGHGLLDHELVQSMWHEHLAEKRDWQYDLWNVVMFQAWMNEWQ